MLKAMSNHGKNLANRMLSKSMPKELLIPYYKTLGAFSDSFEEINKTVILFQKTPQWQQSLNDYFQQMTPEQQPICIHYGLAGLNKLYERDRSGTLIQKYTKLIFTHPSRAHLIASSIISLEDTELPEKTKRDIVQEICESSKASQSSINALTEQLIAQKTGLMTLTSTLRSLVTFSQGHQSSGNETTKKPRI